MGWMTLAAIPIALFGGTSLWTWIWRQDYHDARIRLLVRSPIETLWSTGVLALVVFSIWWVAAPDPGEEVCIEPRPGREECGTYVGPPASERRNWLESQAGYFAAGPAALALGALGFNSYRLVANRRRVCRGLRHEDRALLGILWQYSRIGGGGPTHAWIRRQCAWDVQGWDVPTAIARLEAIGLVQIRDDNVHPAFFEMDGDIPFVEHLRQLREPYC